MSNLLPENQTSEVTGSPKGFPKHWTVLGLLVLAHAVFGAYCISTDKTLCNLTVGVMISQPILLATWAAFARQRFYHRILWSLLICTYVSFADDLGAGQHVGQYEMHFGPGKMILAHLALYVVVLGFLLPVRHFSRWQITQPDASDAPSVYLDHHFGINHLLFLTAIVALACGLVRSLFIITGSNSPYSKAADFSYSVFLLLVASFPSSVVPWITLAPGRKPCWLIPMTISVAGALDAIAYAVSTIRCSDLLPFVPWYVSENLVVPCFWLQLGAILSAVGSTLVLRYCGFRMIREPRAAA